MANWKSLVTYIGTSADSATTITDSAGVNFTDWNDSNIVCAPNTIIAGDITGTAESVPLNKSKGMIDYNPGLMSYHLNFASGYAEWGTNEAFQSYSHSATNPDGTTENPAPGFLLYTNVGGNMQGATGYDSGEDSNINEWAQLVDADGSPNQNPDGFAPGLHIKYFSFATNTRIDPRFDRQYHDWKLSGSDSDKAVLTSSGNYVQPESGSINDKFRIVPKHKHWGEAYPKLMSNNKWADAYIRGWDFQGKTVIDGMPIGAKQFVKTYTDVSGDVWLLYNLNKNNASVGTFDNIVTGDGDPFGTGSSAGWAIANGSFRSNTTLVDYILANAPDGAQYGTGTDMDTNAAGNGILTEYCPVFGDANTAHLWSSQTATPGYSTLKINIGSQDIATPEVTLTGGPERHGQWKIVGNWFLFNHSYAVANMAGGEDYNGYDGGHTGDLAWVEANTAFELSNISAAEWQTICSDVTVPSMTITGVFHAESSSAELEGTLDIVDIAASISGDGGVNATDEQSITMNRDNEWSLSVENSNATTIHPFYGSAPETDIGLNIDVDGSFEDYDIMRFSHVGAASNEGYSAWGYMGFAAPASTPGGSWGQTAGSMIDQIKKASLSGLETEDIFTALSVNGNNLIENLDISNFDNLFEEMPANMIIKIDGTAFVKPGGSSNQNGLTGTDDRLFIRVSGFEN